jgi:hypothetical protein
MLCCGTSAAAWWAVLHAQAGDGFALFEAPDDAAAAAVEILTLPLAARSNRLLRVLSPDEMHTALRQAAAPNIAQPATWRTTLALNRPGVPIHRRARVPQVGP